MNVLPQPIANGRNQNGTIAGKLNGTIAAHTPTGWRIVSASIPRDTSSSTRPCIVVGSARRLDHLDHARHLGPRVGDRLAHLGGHRPRQLLAALVQALPQRKQMTGPRDHRHVTPGRQRRPRGLHGRVEILRRRQRHPGQNLTRSGVRDVERVRTRRRVQPPPT